MRKQGIITHWQKKMLKENPPKDDKKKDKDKDKDKRQRKDKDKDKKR
jgi:hypothetical protein